MQAPIRQDSRCQRVVAKALSLLNFVLVGPASFFLTVVLTIATLGCLPCACFSDATFAETFFAGMDVIAYLLGMECLLQVPVALLASLTVQIRRCCQTRDRSLELSSTEHEAEADPATIV
jgi:hypothetical protein